MEYSVDYKCGRVIYYVVWLFLLIGTIAFAIYHILDYQFVGNLSSCYANEVWHLYCFGCGGTRSLDLLLHGKIIESFFANPIMICMVIYFLSYFLPATYTFVIKRNGNIYYHFQKKLLIFLIVFIAVYSILRNVGLIFFQYDFFGENSKYWVR